MASRHQLLDQLAAELAAGVVQPIAPRIVEHIWLAVVEGQLSTGEHMPTARQLAIALNVSPRVVQRAYRQLEERGVLASRPGEGTFVSLQLPSEEERIRHRKFAELCRRTVEEAAELGFDVDDLLDGVGDFRGADHPPPSRSSRP